MERAGLEPATPSLQSYSGLGGFGDEPRPTSVSMRVSGPAAGRSPHGCVARFRIVFATIWHGSRHGRDVPQLVAHEHRAAPLLVEPAHRPHEVDFGDRVARHAHHPRHERHRPSPVPMHEPDAVGWRDRAATRAPRPPVTAQTTTITSGSRAASGQPARGQGSDSRLRPRVSRSDRGPRRERR